MNTKETKFTFVKSKSSRLVMLKGKRIVIGITGGIAAYKIAFLIRILKSKGAEVKCILTPASSDFITPLTVSTLSQNPAYINFWNKENGAWTNHVELGAWGDLMLIAPLTANTLAKIANGFCDNLLTATYLSAKCPVMVAPAMDLDMYDHFTTHENLKAIEKHGIKVIPAEDGFLASGLIGKGRMAEPETIAEEIERFFVNELSMKGQRVLITAGPTYEAIDPVRFIGNHSSGKMGYALAETAASYGASVVLVSGPVNLKLDNPSVKIEKVTSAAEMYEAAHKYFADCHVAILSAAVADYRPSEVATEKIKKKDEEGTMTIELTKTQDILKSLGEIKKNQFLVGFALETQNEEANAKIKLKKKNLDLIVLNSLRDKGAGFKVDTNKVTLISKDNKVLPFPVKDKSEVAKDILKYIIEKSYA